MTASQTFSATIQPGPGKSAHLPLPFSPDQRYDYCPYCGKGVDIENDTATE